MISIISVVYKDYEGLEKTFYSIEKQVCDFSQIEYIVIDGGSDCKKIDAICRTGFVAKYISEPDDGIYDAMNKGIAVSTGKWIIFLNAGDTFETKSVLSKLLNVTKEMSYGENLIYGGYKADGIEYSQKECSLNFLVSHMINHQSMIYHRSLLEHGYDKRYRFCADYAHLLSVWHKLKPRSLNYCIANFDTTGVSSQASNKARMWYERLYAVWRSDLPLTQKLMLSRRGIIALPYHTIKNWLKRMVNEPNKCGG